VTANDERVRYTAVVMAGTRSGGDPLAAVAGVSHKCLVEVGGKPMLLRMLETLEASSRVRDIVLCVENTLPGIDYLASRIEDGTLRRLDAAASPAASATRAAEYLGDDMPLLIVTADHPLLDETMLEHFCARASRAGDIAAAVARSEVVLARYPEATRTLLRFADGPYCGCNLFALNTPAATVATRFWMQIESERKRPWRIVHMLGLVSLVSYLRGRLVLDKAMNELSQNLGIRAGIVEMPFAEAAIDVDKPADLALVESVLAKPR